MSTLKSSLVGFGTRLAIVAVLIVNTLMLARSLGPQRYGIYFIFIRVVSVLAIIADFGLSQSANAFVGRHEHWMARINLVLLGFVLIFSAGSIALGATIYGWVGDRLLPGFSWKWMEMSFGALPLALYAAFWNNMIVGMGRIWLLNLVRLATNILSLALTVVFIVVLAGGPGTAAMIYVIALAVQFLVMLTIAFHLGTTHSNNESPAGLAQQMLRFGLRGHVGAILYIFWSQLPAFFLNAIHGAGTVGVFSVAQQIVEKVLLPIQALQDVVYKKMAVLSSQAATTTMNRYIRVTWWGMWVVVLAGVVVAPWAIVRFLGPAFMATAGIVRLLFVGTAFMSVSMLLDTYFINQLRRPGLISILAGINLAISIITALLVVPPLGAKGAGWTLVLTQSLGTVLMLYLYMRIAGARPYEFLRLSRDDVILIREQLCLLIGWKWSRQ